MSTQETGRDLNRPPTDPPPKGRKWAWATGGGRWVSVDESEACRQVWVGDEETGQWFPMRVVPWAAEDPS